MEQFDTATEAENPGFLGRKARNIGGRKGLEWFFLDQEVLEGLRQRDILSRNPEEELQSSLRLGQRLADESPI
jgi:hypothetical protein